jgi:integrase
VGRITRDDRSINQHFLRPAAKALGIYWEGFGFHSFRREAVTELSAMAGPAQVQRMAGHTKADMTLHYSVSDHVAQDAPVRTMQERIRGTAEVIEIRKGA